MNLLLFIQYPNHFSRVIVTDTESVLSAIESTNDQIRMCENLSALNKIGQIMSGETKPLVNYLAGNSYFGKVTFKFTRPYRRNSPERIYSLTVKVYSALGTTMEEHDERYKRLKAIKYQGIIENRINHV